MAPRLIDHGDSLDVVWEEAVYTEARLQADPHAVELAPRMTQFITRIDTVRTGQYAVWRDEIVAQAHIDAADRRLDTVVDVTCKTLERVDEDNPDEARKGRYVRKGLTAKKIIALKLEVEMKTVGDWPASLETEPEARLRATAAPLADALTRGQEALDGRTLATGRRRDFTARVRSKLVDEFNDLRLDLHADLSKQVIPNGLDRAWPDDFFRKGSNRKDSPDTGVTEGEGTPNAPA